MADLRVALEDLVADSTAASVSGTPAAQISGRRAVAWPAVIVIVIIATAGYFGWQAMRSPEPLSPLRAVPLTALRGMVRSPSLSPDGQHVAFAWTGPKQDNPDIYVQQIGAGSPLRLTTDADNDYSPAWAPDGRAIAF